MVLTQTLSQIMNHNIYCIVQMKQPFGQYLLHPTILQVINPLWKEGWVTEE